jgi:hypothetical protein
MPLNPHEFHSDCTRSAHEIAQAFDQTDFLVQSIIGAMEKLRSSRFITAVSIAEARARRNRLHRRRLRPEEQASSETRLHRCVKRLTAANWIGGGQVQRLRGALHDLVCFRVAKLAGSASLQR